MMHFRLVSLAVLVLAAAICNGEFSASPAVEYPPQQDSRFVTGLLVQVTDNLNSVLNISKETLLKTADLVKGTIKSALQRVRSLGSKLKETLHNTVTHTSQQVNMTMAILHEQSPESKYDKCFAASPISDVANKTIDDAMKCITDILDKAQNTGNSLIENLQIVVGVINGQEAIKESCKDYYYQNICIQAQNSLSMISLASAANNISTTSLAALNYFSTINTQSFDDCNRFQVHYQDIASNTLLNAFNCIHEVMNKKE